MRRRELQGRIKTLINNVNDSFDLFLKSEAVINEQIKSLELKEEIKDIKWNYKINFEINGIKYKTTKTNGGHISNKFTYGWNNKEANKK